MAIGLTTDGRVFTVRLSPDVSEQINTLAQREYETPTTVLRRLVRWGLDHQQRVDQLRSAETGR
jgi:predicted transcriptional regulator